MTLFSDDPRFNMVICNNMDDVRFVSMNTEKKVRKKLGATEEMAYQYTQRGARKNGMRVV